MIHLDTNYLIKLASDNREVVERIQLWIKKDEKFATSSVAWAEFLNGPLEDDQRINVESFLENRIFSFTKEHSPLSAKLYNASGRRRDVQLDCMIASVAIAEGHFLATLNTKDFKPFTRFGLHLIN